MTTKGKEKSKLEKKETTPAHKRNSFEKLFLIVILVLLAIFGPFTYFTYEMIQSFKNNMPEGYRWPEMSEFWFSGVFAVVCYIVQVVFEKIFYHSFYPICKEKNDEEARVVRTKKAVKNIYKFLYYLSSLIFGYVVLKDSHVLPFSLGGSGSFDNQFKDFPYIKTSTMYTYYYRGSMGYHVSQLLVQIFNEDWQKSDFIEMTLHHLVTVYLYGFSYMSNMMIGGPVAFLHNWADMMNSWTRIWAETVYQKVAGYSFLIAQIVWFYTRLIIFPYLIYVSTIKLEINAVSPYIINIFGFLMWCLFVLHIYWFILMQKILFYFLKKGEAEDIVNKNKGTTLQDGPIEHKKKME